jgi:hypothetical protein
MWSTNPSYPTWSLNPSIYKAATGRRWFAPVWQARDQASALEAYAGVCTLIGARAAPIFEIVRRAAGESAEIAELWATLCRNRRAGSAMVVEKILESGPLRAGVSRDQAIDSLWVLNGPTPYGALVLDSGWPEDHHRRWLAAQMRAALLPGDPYRR